MAPLAPLGCGYLTGEGTVFDIFKPKPFTRLANLEVGTVRLADLLAARAEGVENVGC